MDYFIDLNENMELYYPPLTVLVHRKPYDCRAPGSPSRGRSVPTIPFIKDFRLSEFECMNFIQSQISDCLNFIQSQIPDYLKFIQFINLKFSDYRTNTEHIHIQSLERGIGRLAAGEEQHKIQQIFKKYKVEITFPQSPAFKICNIYYIISDNVKFIQSKTNCMKFIRSDEIHTIFFQIQII